MYTFHPRFYPSRERKWQIQTILSVEEILEFMFSEDLSNQIDSLFQSCNKIWWCAHSFFKQILIHSTPAVPGIITINEYILVGAQWTFSSTRKTEHISLSQLSSKVGLLVCELWPMDRPSVFINKILLKYSHNLSFTYCFMMLFIFLFDPLFFSVSFWILSTSMLSCFLIFSSEMFNLPLIPFLDFIFLISQIITFHLQKLDFDFFFPTSLLN